MFNITPQIRGTDDYGSGAYGSSRGDRKHEGIDFIVLPCHDVLSLNNGTVTLLGYTYKDDLSYRYVQVTDLDGNDVRYFYTSPTVSVGTPISKGDKLGTAQCLGKRYDKDGKTITPHIHFEVKLGRKYLDPEMYLGLV